MFEMSAALPIIWAFLIATAILLYALLDGFDLGVGLLFPAMRGIKQRDQAMNTVAPVWDGNETWLILGGGGLYAVFPLAYATILPALYMPVLLMLFGLIFRGVAFEFRWRTKRGKTAWDVAFFMGSLTAAFSQGIILGALVQGIQVADRAYIGGWWDWLTPFSLFCGLALCIGYSLLGATWLIMKTDGAVRVRAYRIAWRSAFAMALAIVIISLWTVLLDTRFLQRWFSPPSVYFVMLVPIITSVLIIRLFVSLNDKRDSAPFWAAVGLFVTCYLGLGISMYPHIVPPSITIFDASGPPESLGFLLVGTIVLLPIILGYTAYAYWVFRGKTPFNGGYH